MGKGGQKMYKIAWRHLWTTPSVIKKKNEFVLNTNETKKVPE